MAGTNFLIRKNAPGKFEQKGPQVTVSPEKIRQTVEALAATQMGMSLIDWGGYSRVLLSAADELERLQKPQWWYADAEPECGGETMREVMDGAEHYEPEKLRAARDVKVVYAVKCFDDDGNSYVKSFETCEAAKAFCDDHYERESLEIAPAAASTTIHETTDK